MKPKKLYNLLSIGLIAFWISLSMFITCMFTSCDMTGPYIPIIPIDTDTTVTPIDTIGTDSFVVDTCTEYIDINTPSFVCFFVNLDLPLIDTTYIYNGLPIDPAAFFTSLYYSGQNIGGIIDGSNNAINLNGKIWVRDGSGAKHYLAFWSRGLYFRGALTIDEYFDELITHPSARLLNFRNTGYSCDEITQILDFVLQDCKSGQGTIDLRGIGCMIDQAIIDELILRGWIVWE